MSEITATATEMQNDFPRYLSHVLDGDEVIVTSNGKVVGRFLPQEAIAAPLTHSLKGILKEDTIEKRREEALMKKYGLSD